MRILALVTDAYGGHGGIATYNRCLVEAMAASARVSEVVVVPRVARFEAGELPAKVRNEADGLGGKHRYLRSVLKVAREPFDLVICGHVNLLRLAAPLAALRRAPLVLQVHGIDAWTPIRPVDRALLGRADEIWSVSQLTVDKMRSWSGLPQERFRIIPNMVDLDRFGESPRNAALAARLGLEGKTVLMTMARLAGFDRAKGIDEILEVLPALARDRPSLMYLVAGDGEDRGRLEQKASDLGVSQRVVFAGYVPEELKRDYYSLADAFVLPGQGEGFGIVFLEALACGVPALGSLLDGSREALRGGELGELVDPRDLAGVKAGVERVLARPRGVPPGLSYFDRGNFLRRVDEALGRIANR